MNQGQKIKTLKKGAGILPFVKSKIDNKLYFLFHQVFRGTKIGSYIDFGGAVDQQDNQQHNQFSNTNISNYTNCAIREFAEETLISFPFEINQFNQIISTTITTITMSYEQHFTTQIINYSNLLKHYYFKYNYNCNYNCQHFPIHYNQLNDQSNNNDNNNSNIWIIKHPTDYMCFIIEMNFLDQQNLNELYSNKQKILNFETKARQFTWISFEQLRSSLSNNSTNNDNYNIHPRLPKDQLLQVLSEIEQIYSN
eukprot:TRINITY_DN3415_c0_g2_i1.p1 TRINITY_DN3415_c0_g2~~TRINITY_DN3415_c0_g2_i1.p1  ORF type:complete len:253 (+),score=70.82 TRINITY_DN3415_c0_g2_i1:80-838(+)